MNSALYQNDSQGDRRFEKTEKLSMRTVTVSGNSVTDCLLQAKQSLGADAIIISRKTYKKGALFGKWGGKEIVEMTFGTYLPPSHPMTQAAPATPPAPLPSESGLRFAGGNATQEAIPQKVMAPFVAAPFAAANAPAAVLETAPVPKRARGKKTEVTAPAPIEGYPGLTQQLIDTDFAAPLARQLIAEIPAGLTSMDSAAYLRTVLSQRLRIAPGLDAQPSYGKMRLLAFIGTTGVGKSTTIAKLTARLALLERRRVGIVTLDTHRIGAAEQLQMYGDILRVPVKIAHDKLELIHQVSAFKEEGMEIVLLDTAGRSPNEMIPLGETAHLFEGMGAIQKYLAMPATLGTRDMENVVSRFQNIFTPDAVILTKLDEVSDNTCFGRLMTMQAKFGLPLAYITTGQRVPDDIVIPDPHAIAARILTTVL